MSHTNHCTICSFRRLKNLNKLFNSLEHLNLMRCLAVNTAHIELTRNAGVLDFLELQPNTLPLLRQALQFAVIAFHADLLRAVQTTMFLAGQHRKVVDTETVLSDSRVAT
jgi:hypothetical protein